MTTNKPFGFVYRDDLLTQFPEIVGGVLHVTGLHNGPSPVALLELYQDDSTNILVTVEGHHANAHADIAAALADLAHLLQHFAGGTILSGLLDGSQPAFPAAK